MQVLREDTTGAADLNFFHAEITNAYINITNIVLKISPIEAASNQTILVNAHFDTSLGTPGEYLLGQLDSYLPPCVL